MLNQEFVATNEKIPETCLKNDLEFTLESMKFPIIATLSPDLEKFDQMRFKLPGEEERKEQNYVQGKIRFIFGEELTMDIINDFMIEDKLLNRIKNQIKNLHYLYLQLYFKEKTKLGGIEND